MSAPIGTASSAGDGAGPVRDDVAPARPHSPAVSHRPVEATTPRTPTSDASREVELLRRAQTGDRGAFGQFVVATQDRLYTVLVRLVGDRDEARELAQEAYLRALSHLDSFRHSAAPYTWLYRIAVNLAVARLRKVRRQRTFTLADAGLDRVSATDRPDEAMEKRERDRHVVAALGRLDAEFRAILVMRDVDGLDYKDISDVLELPLGTVKSRIFRARLALREELLRLGYGTAPTANKPPTVESPKGISGGAGTAGGAP